METKNALFDYLVRLADNALILGHRLSELCSRGPMLEEDLALTNISLDMIGRAQLLLKYAADTEGQGRTEDDIAYRREEKEYHNLLIFEQSNGDFARVMARQLYIAAFEFLFYTELQKSKDTTLAAIAGRTAKEIKYHLQHAADWTIRLGDGTEESKAKIQKAVNDLWPYTGELFEMDETDLHLLGKGIGVDLAPLRNKWESNIAEVLAEATLQLPQSHYMHSGGKRGVHSENLGHILAEMQYLQRAYPDAKW